MAILQGLCSYGGRLYAAWKGEVGDDRLFYSSFDGRAWSDAQILGGNSSVGPSLGTFGSSMFVAWKGEHGDERLFYAALTGTTWSAQGQIPGVLSSGGPALAAFEDSLFAAWKGGSSDQEIWYASFGGSGWSGQATVPGAASGVGPSLAVFDGRLYFAWKGEGNDQRLFYASLENRGWSLQAVINGATSSVGPSLATFNGRLYAAWKGNSADQQLWYATFDGRAWSVPVMIPAATSSTGPSLAVFGDRLYTMWKGAGTDQRLWYASFDGAGWSVPANIPGNTGQDLPQNIGLRMQYQESSNWCWIAVGTSINHFYNSASTATQCGIMTIVGHSVNGFPANTSACPSVQAVTSVPGLAAILADPYLSDAQNVLDNTALGIPKIYLKTGGVGDALKVHGNWNTATPASPTLAQITGEIIAGRPVAVDITWPSGSGHCVAIAGVLDDQVLICDPAFGESAVVYESFPATYHGGATLADIVFTQKGT
jgi:hypothetical protein